ncbi:MAG: hypothetical protein ACLUSP_07085 [Christensenellales bacterium]
MKKRKIPEFRASRAAGCRYGGRRDRLRGQNKTRSDPAADDYDVKYVSTMPSGTDDGVTIDGVLSESVYAVKKRS